MILLSEKIEAGLRNKPKFSLAAAFGAGSLTVLSMPPWFAWPALWVGFTALYILISFAETKKSAFWRGWFFGFGYFIFGLAWTANALTVEGSTYSWVIPIAIAGLPALLSIFTGAACLLAARLGDMRRFSGFLAFAGFMTLFEWLRGHVLSGFPWNLYGYGWAGVPQMTQLAALAGAYGLTLLTVLWAALPGLLYVSAAKARRKAVMAACLYALLAAGFIWGGQRLATHPTLYQPDYFLRIVQPSISQTLKWDNAKTMDSFRRTVDASLLNDTKLPANATVLMIWPETAVQQDTMQDPQTLKILDEAFAHYPERFFLATGLLRWEPRGEKVDYFNSIGVFDRQLNLMETYDKAHLVPFGEYIPLSRWLPANPLVAAEGFAHGPGPVTLAVPPKETDPFKISPMICYEAIFPGAVVQRDTRPGLLLNVTNDGWYGDSAGPQQHLEISRFRAIEEGVPMARAANTGVSAVIDAYGRVLWRSKIFEITARTSPLPLAAPDATPYSRYGDLPALILIALCCLACARRPSLPKGSLA